MPMLTYRYVQGVPAEISYALAILAVISFIALCILLFKTIRSDKEGEQK